MSVKAIYEQTAKSLIRNSFPPSFKLTEKSIIATPSELPTLPQLHPWLLTESLVCKPDELIKRRGKLGLVIVRSDYDGVCRWIREKTSKPLTIGTKNGNLQRFLIEPFIQHQKLDEHYVCMFTQRDGDVILFCSEGGVDVGNVDAKAKKFQVTTQSLFDHGSGAVTPNHLLDSGLLDTITDPARKRILAEFIAELHRVFAHLHFNYLEINPLVVTSDPNTPGHLRVHILDVAAKLDQCAEYLFSATGEWSPDGIPVVFPPPFGLSYTPEERLVAELDARTGASMKLTLLNPNARIWTVSAGGGASVIFADTICQLAPNGAADLANYGEYSGAPSESQTYEYARTILSLMTRGPVNPQGKILLVGGGVANFTNVAATFKGVIRAITEHQNELRAHSVSIWVRRGGPNYQEGLRAMRLLGESLQLPIHVFGPDTHMTAIVSMALGLQTPSESQAILAKPSLFQRELDSNGDAGTGTVAVAPSLQNHTESHVNASPGKSTYQSIFGPSSRCIVWGLQLKAVQSMLDFDFACGRSTPSVAALVYPFTEDRTEKFYWGSEECLIPVFKVMERAFHAHPDARILVNFASYRAAYQVTLDAMAIPRAAAPTTGGPQKLQLTCVAVIAEGIPERLSRALAFEARRRGVVLIGPATVGGIRPGCFKIGNSGGMMDNILASRLHRPGSVAYVSRSGGMSNELNNIIALNTDGVAEGVAIGGDRFPGSTFLDHILRYEADPSVHMLVLLGEVGGVEEYAVADAIAKGLVKKPLVAWCIGTCAELLVESQKRKTTGLTGGGDAAATVAEELSEVQFGHAGACAQSARETAVEKNRRLAQVGAHVPSCFNELDVTIRKVFDSLVKAGKVVPKPDRPANPVPMDYSWAKELGLVRRTAGFTSTICDDRGQELLYAGMPVGRVLEEGMGIGGVLGLLWFKRRLPAYAAQFLERCIIVAADHGPAVSGAHNTIVAARANKDLVSSLTSGLLTIGDRFGGALDAAARDFSTAFDSGLSPSEFVDSAKAAGRFIMGIGHRIKSVTNPDTRVRLLADFARANFPATPLMDYAFEVEKVTTAKRPTLILNVDGLIGVAMVDLLRHCGAFTRREADEYVELGTLNGLFVLARSIGFIGHYLDQRRLRQGLYRHPWDDISYKLPKMSDLDGV
ncbi:hypothetical protein SprV_0902748700 [Sparganum proliferum]